MIFDLSDIPEKHKALFDRHNKKAAEAMADPLSPKRVHAGFYYMQNADGELVEIDSLEESSEWIVREAGKRNGWYSDPYPSYRDAVAAMRRKNG